jgi:hypothetical protein
LDAVYAGVLELLAMEVLGIPIGHPALLLIRRQDIGRGTILVEVSS